MKYQQWMMGPVQPVPPLFQQEVLGYRCSNFALPEKVYGKSTWMKFGRLPLLLRQNGSRGRGGGFWGLVQRLGLE